MTAAAYLARSVNYTRKVFITLARGRLNTGEIFFFFAKMIEIVEVRKRENLDALPGPIFKNFFAAS
jgi:hypothetical protein